MPDIFTSNYTLSSQICVGPYIGKPYIADGTIVYTDPVDTIQPSTILKNILATIPEDLYDLSATSNIYKIHESLAKVLSDLAYWIFFARLSIGLNTARYDKLDRNFGDLLDIGRLDGKYDDGRGNIVYDPNVDETYKYNPYDTQTTEEFYISESGFQLLYINVDEFSEQVRQLYGDKYYFRDRDYVIDYVDGCIYATKMTNIPQHEKLQITYTAGILHGYEWDKGKDDITMNSDYHVPNLLSHKELDPETFVLYPGTF